MTGSMDEEVPLASGRVRSPVDFLTGLLFLAIGGTGLWLGRDWPMGTLAMMDSGFLPRVLSAIVALSGVGLIVKAFLVRGPVFEGIVIRPLLAVIAAVVAFAFLIETLGLVLAITAVVTIGGFAGERPGPIAFLVLTGSLILLCVAVFIWGVELPIKVWPF